MIECIFKKGRFRAAAEIFLAVKTIALLFSNYLRGYVLPIIAREWTDRKQTNVEFFGLSPCPFK